ncbi:MAG: ion channel [Candidatus Sericytochromatia bacterium]
MAELQSPVHWLTVGITLMVLIGVVLLHYEVLSTLNAWLPRLAIPARPKVLVGIVGALMVHIAEIWIFGIVFFLMAQNALFGAITGYPHLGIFDYVYFSAEAYTTVGFGELTARGPMRLLVGMEALLGFVLITWSASFTFLEMARYWNTPDRTP